MASASVTIAEMDWWISRPTQAEMMASTSGK
jgi:hypothetical protein